MAVFTTTNSGISENQNAMIGKWENPLRMIIENESDVCGKDDDLVRALFEVSRSTHFGESFVTQSDFDIFAPVAEGADAVQDSFAEQSAKFIANTTFKKQFRVTMEMMEDAQTAQMEMMARRFVRSYYRTRNLLATQLLTGATGNTLEFGTPGNTMAFDLTAADGLPLLSRAHADSGNRFSHVLTGELDCAAVEKVLSAAVGKMRNVCDSHGYPLGYTADTVMIPCDDPKLEIALKRVLGSELGGGILDGGCSLHYGNWTLIVNPLWRRENLTSHPMIIFSSAARRNLGGAVFLDRKPLTVSAHVDQDSGDYIWNGVARMSAGFVSHKWICSAEILDAGTSALFDAGTAGSDSIALEL